MLGYPAHLIGKNKISKTKAWYGSKGEAKGDEGAEGTGVQVERACRKRTKGRHCVTKVPISKLLEVRKFIFIASVDV